LCPQSKYEKTAMEKGRNKSRTPGEEKDREEWRKNFRLRELSQKKSPWLDYNQCGEDTSKKGPKKEKVHLWEKTGSVSLGARFTLSKKKKKRKGLLSLRG